MEIGVCSFADVAVDAAGGRGIDAGQRIRDLIEEIELADQVGLDVFGVGEHHRADYAVSAPVVVLAAAAARTHRIRLTSAVTVLSSDEPVRVFQQFATLDQISGGRAEIMAGRGSFIESFPLFGYELDDYNELFTEKLELLLRLRDAALDDRPGGGTVTWTGRHRAPLNGARVHPLPAQRPLPVWVAVGGTPQSVRRAAILGLPLAVAIIGGAPDRFAPLVDYYRQAAGEAGHDASALPVGINIHGWLAEDSQEAADEFFPPYAEVMTRIGRERGWPATTRQQFEMARSRHGALAVGSPQEVIDRTLQLRELFGHQRMLFQLGLGPLPHGAVMRAIELLGTVVAPAIRKES